MKLPKPKKLNIPIRNRFLKKNLLSLIVVAVLAAGTGTVYGTLSSHVVDRGQDPVNGVNQDRYQVLVSGKGYKLSKQQEKNYKLQKKQNQVNAINDARNPNTINNAYGSRTFRSTNSYRFNNRYRYSSHSSFKSSKKPRIMSDLSSEINKLDNPVAGDTFKIKVSAYAYPYGNKNAISSNQIKVNVEGGSATLYKSKSGSHYYKIELGEGKNKITITATDKKAKKTAKVGPYTVKVGARKSDSGNSGGSGGTNTDPSSGGNGSESQEPKTKAVSVSVNYGDDAIDLKGEVAEDLTLKEALQEMGVEFDESKIIFVPGEFKLDKLDSKLKEYYIEKLNEGEEVDEGDEDYIAWLNEAKESMKDGIGRDCPFDSTYWTCESGLDTKVKDLSSGIKLNLVLYED